MTCDVIATGSRGNAVVLDGNILIDCGVPFRDLEGIYQKLAIVVLTHIHGDHFAPETLRQLAFRRPTLRFLCPPWLHQPLRSIGISEKVIDTASTAYVLSYGRLPGGSFPGVVFHMDPIPHDVPNCAWHIFFGGSEAALYATDCGSLDAVEARDYDLYLLEANYKEDELEERMQQKLAAGRYAYEPRAAANHLSQEQAKRWLAENAREGRSKVLFLHQHQEKAPGTPGAAQKSGCAGERRTPEVDAALPQDQGE